MEIARIVTFGASTASRSGGSAFSNLRPGMIIAVEQEEGSETYEIRSVPQVSGGMVVQEVATGRVLAMQGGFDARLGDFNRAWGTTAGTWDELAIYSRLPTPPAGSDAYHRLYEAWVVEPRRDGQAQVAGAEGDFEERSVVQADAEGGDQPRCRIDRGQVQPSDKGALTQVYLGGVTFELESNGRELLAAGATTELRARIGNVRAVRFELEHPLAGAVAVVDFSAEALVEGHRRGGDRVHAEPGRGRLLRPEA